MANLQTSFIIYKKDNLKFAKKLSKSLLPGDIYGLMGKLGAGKTTFVQNLIQSLGSKKKALSPTFTLMHVYPIKIKQKPINIYHADFYRIENEKEAIGTGIQEAFLDPNGAIFIEWADRFPSLLPKKTKWLIFRDNA